MIGPHQQTYALSFSAFPGMHYCTSYCSFDKGVAYTTCVGGGGVDTLVTLAFWAQV